ncbi:NAD-dependent epimerase/dehydratase family protein, partial [Streptomyces sparsogenes]
MRVLVAGATGVVGHPLVGALRARGHQVSALVREESRAKAPDADAVVVADALDRQGLLSAVAAVRPEAVVHQMTALRLLRDDPAAAFARTARLRTEGTANLVEAAPGGRGAAAGRAEHRLRGGPGRWAGPRRGRAAVRGRPGPRLGRHRTGRRRAGAAGAGRPGTGGRGTGGGGAGGVVPAGVVPAGQG